MIDTGRSSDYLGIRKKTVETYTYNTIVRFYNVTSLVHSYIVITVFLGLVSGLLLVHPGAF